MNSQLSLLFPRPQQLDTTGTHFTLPDRPCIYLASSPQQILPTAQRLEQSLLACGLQPQLTATVTEKGGRPDVHITLQINPPLLNRPQSYRLIIDEAGITLIGADEAGLFYAVCTLHQLLRLYAPATDDDHLTLPGLRITDWPDFPHRGVMLDVSRDKVPTMETLFDLVDLLASWKINQLQLYMEHTFAYRGHEVVWQHATPFTGEELLALDAFCRSRHLELVPNQNSFGHMQRWLVHEPYRQLAECPDGFQHPFSSRREPYSLCPIDPGSLTLLSDLYDQLLPHFSSRQFNVGLDETFDLGHGRSAEVCAEKGIGRVYLEFLQQIHRLVTQRGRTMQFWGDIILHQPELIGALPKDAIALEWGYEADHPFAEHGRLFAEAGLSFYVCPGTSSWNTFAGRTDNTLANLSSAAASGRATGAIGFLNTDWGDNGHMQPLPVSYLGFLVGAGLSWNSAHAADTHGLDIPGLLDVHAFRDRAGVMGRLAYDLGNAYLHNGARIQNNSALFLLLLFAEHPLLYPLIEGMNIEGLEKTLAFVDQAMASLPAARMERSDADLIVEEFAWVADMLRLACSLGIARLQAGPDAPLDAVPAKTRASLADQLRLLIQHHRQLWLRRNRPGGLDDSAARLERILTLLNESASTSA
jgi:hexosaminidase